MTNPFQGAIVARRPAVMWTAQRAPALAWFGMVARSAAHNTIGAPATHLYTFASITIIALSTPGLVWPAALAAGAIATAAVTRGRWGLFLGAAVLAGALWAAYLVATSTTGRVAVALVIAVATLEYWAGTLWPNIATWRRTWAFRRLWPNRAAAADYGTNDMRASFGGGGVSNFLRASKNLPRPVVNHPPLGRPHINYQKRSATFRVGPPGAPGAQTVADIETMLPSIIEGFNFVDDITLNVPANTLTAWFESDGDYLADQIAADLATPPDDPNIPHPTDPADLFPTAEPAGPDPLAAPIPPAAYQPPQEDP